MQTQQLVYRKQGSPPDELLRSAEVECGSKDQMKSCGVLVDWRCEVASAQASPSCWQYLFHVDPIWLHSVSYIRSLLATTDAE